MLQLKNHVEKCDVDNAVLKSRLKEVKDERDKYIKKAEKLFYELKNCRHDLDIQT
jgi:hypothetical protein